GRPDGGRRAVRARTGGGGAAAGIGQRAGAATRAQARQVSVGIVPSTAWLASSVSRHAVASVTRRTAAATADNDAPSAATTKRSAVSGRPDGPVRTPAASTDSATAAQLTTTSMPLTT